MIHFQYEVRDTSEKEKEMQYHYVVTYDSLNKTFTVDVDTADAVLHNGYFYDEQTQQWLDPDSELLPFYQEDYLEVEEQLAKLVVLPPTVVCPNHEGGFDCTPFCNLCEGNQEYRPEN